MGYAILILTISGVAAAGIVAYSVLFYRRGVTLGGEALKPALQRIMESDDEEKPTQEELRDATSYLSRRFTLVAALSALAAMVCLAVFIVTMATGSARETGTALLGLALLLLSGCVGLMITRRLIPLMEESLEDMDS